MKCPKCGHEQAGSIECEACGIIFAKYRQHQDVLAELSSLRSSPRRSANSLPYKWLGAGVALMVLLGILFLTGGETQTPKQVVVPASETPAAETVAVETDNLPDSPYKILNGYNLDHTLLRFLPDLAFDQVEEFNYPWIMAYHCEYASEIKKDNSRFYEVMRKTMDEALQYRDSYPVKYRHQGDVRVRIVLPVRDEVEIQSVNGVRKKLTGGREYNAQDCPETSAMKTDHVVTFSGLRRHLSIEIPREILQSLNFPKGSFELEADIRFRIDSVRYLYNEQRKVYTVWHKAVIEEMDLLNNDNAARKDRIFMTLSESQLY